MKDLKHVFIINPTSGVQDSKKVIPWIKEYFEDEADYEIFVTEYPGHATEIASRFSVRDHVCIYSVGGDGTAYEVLNGLNDGVTMSLIPNGTGNDFHRTIYKDKFNLKDMLIQTIEGDIYNIDFGVVNEHRFLNMFTVGFDAYIGKLATEAEHSKVIPNSLSYVVAVLKALKNLRTFNAKFKYNNQNIDQDAIVFAVLNGQYYGGGFNPTPEASIVDGLFNVLLIEPVSRINLMRLLPTYAKGFHSKLKQIQSFDLKSFELKTDKPMVYVCDGEVFEDDYFVVTMMENRLPFRMPKGSVYDDRN